MDWRSWRGATLAILTIVTILLDCRPRCCRCKTKGLHRWTELFRRHVIRTTMPLLPVSTVRTSTPLATQRLLFQLNADQLASSDTTTSSARAVACCGCPMIPAARAAPSGLHRGIDRGNQLVRNAQSTARFYQTADDALGSRRFGVDRSPGGGGSGGPNRPVGRRAGGTFLHDSANDQSVFAAGNTIYRDHQLLGGFLDRRCVPIRRRRDRLLAAAMRSAEPHLGAGRPSDDQRDRERGIGSQFGLS